MHKSIKSRIVENIAGCFYCLATKKLGYNVLNDEQTIDYIVAHNSSVARFGDGEFNIMSGRGIAFQEFTENLDLKLKEVMATQNRNILICIPIGLVQLDKRYTKFAKKFWKSYTVLHYKYLKKLINCDRQIYGNASFTRFYMDFKKKDMKASIERVERIKRIWESRDVVIIEGEYTRCGVGNDLFDNAKSLSRILCPATDAFSKYNQILQVIKNEIPNRKNTLILCCLGPTATCLAYGLSLSGYQAIDLGHLDIEYEWALHGYKDKKKIFGKAVSEAGCNNIQENLLDEKYNSEIITKIF